MSSEQPIKKFLNIITEATVIPPEAPTRANCIAQIKDLDFPDQIKTIRSWLDRKRIGPSLYNDLMQYAKTNYWTTDTNQTNEGEVEEAKNLADEEPDELIVGLAKEFKIPVDMAVKLNNSRDEYALVYEWVKTGVADLKTFKRLLNYISEH